MAKTTSILLSRIETLACENMRLKDTISANEHNLHAYKKELEDMYLAKKEAEKQLEVDNVSFFKMYEEKSQEVFDLNNKLQNLNKEIIELQQKNKELVEENNSLKQKQNKPANNSCEDVFDIHQVAENICREYKYDLKSVQDMAKRLRQTVDVSDFDSIYIIYTTLDKHWQECVGM